MLEKKVPTTEVSVTKCDIYSVVVYRDRAEVRRVVHAHLCVCVCVCVCVCASRMTIAHRRYPNTPPPSPSPLPACLLRNACEGRPGFAPT